MFEMQDFEDNILITQYSLKSQINMLVITNSGGGIMHYFTGKAYLC